MTPNKHAWQARAEEMARFTLDHLVARADGFGRSMDGRWTTMKTGLQMQDLIGHFKSESTIGIHPLGTDGRVRFLAVDVDAHDDDELRAKVDADAVRQRLDDLGLAFLEEDSDGRGGRHFWLGFESPLVRHEAIRLRQVIKDAVGDSLEVFPKGELRGVSEFAGGFIRLPGQHHTRSHFSRFIVDGRFLAGEEAVEAWIHLPLNPTEVVSRLVTEEHRRGQKTQKRTEACRGEQKMQKYSEVCTSEQKPAEDSEAHPRHVLCVPSVSCDAARDIIAGAQDRIDRLIRSTAPSKVGERNWKLFRLAQCLRAIPGLDAVPTRSLKPVIQQWHTSHLEAIGTKAYDETWADFCRAWPRVKHPCDPYRLELAFSEPVTPLAVQIRDANGYDSPGIDRLLSACLRLAEAHDDGVFFLACRSVAPQLGISHRYAADFLHMLVIDEVLILVEQGRPPNIASRYAIHPDERLALGASDD